MKTETSHQWHSTSFTWGFLGKGRRGSTDLPERKSLHIARLLLKDITTGYTLAIILHTEANDYIALRKLPYILNVVIVPCVAGASYFFHLLAYKNNSMTFSPLYANNAYNHTEKYNLYAQVRIHK